MAEYISCTDTAKLVRAALKKAFPGHKFSVRSEYYSGGASIRVHYKDNLNHRAVEEVVEAYQGAGFDGMIDMKYHMQHWLSPDGEARLAKDPGTVGSRGIYPASEYDAPGPDWRLVRFGADYIFCAKELP